MSTSYQQMDLLGWQAPDPVIRFDERAVRAKTLDARLSRAIAAALSGHDRGAVAQTMTAILGRPVSKNMVDAYASAAREDHPISAPRYMALTQAIADRRLLEVMAEPMGWTVIERRFLPLIQLAAVREHEDALRRHGDALRRQARQGGLL